MTDLPYLLLRVEEATHGSLSLDVDILNAVWPEWQAQDGDAERYVTTSLDAALALMKRCGWRAYSMDSSIGDRWSWLLESDARDDADLADYARGVGKTHALGLICALLRALIASGSVSDE